jgi:D-xylose transport system ATP-binding protein
MSKNRKVILRVEEISKNFGSVVALNNINLEIYQNEIVGLVGDNGAGKSTLIKIISGNFPPDNGAMYLEEKKVYFKSPEDSRREGIETVYQDLSLCENLDSISNLFVGREVYKKFLGLRLLQKKDMERKTMEVLNEIDIKIPSVKEKVEYLSGGQRQAVSLGRFVAWGKKLILLDEPTAALGVRETRKALDLVIKIRNERKISIIFISHNLQQIFEIVDRIIVLRHGEIVGIRKKKETTPDEIVSLITGALYVENDTIKK